MGAGIPILIIVLGGVVALGLYVGLTGTAMIEGARSGLNPTRISPSGHLVDEEGRVWGDGD